MSDIREGVNEGLAKEQSDGNFEKIILQYITILDMTMVVLRKDK